MAVETAFTTAMTRIRTASRDADALVLGGEGVELRFTPLEPPPTAAMVGTEWRLESMLLDEVATAAAGDPATLVLHPDGRFEGSTGCRSFTGRWTETTGRIVATELSMDQTECPPELAAQDSHVTQVLGEYGASIDGDALTLTARGGYGLRYRAGS